MADPATITRLAVWLGHSLAASSDLFGEFDTDRFGVRLPDDVLAAGPVSAALSHAAAAAANVDAATTDLETAANGDDQSQHAPALIAFGAALTGYFAAVHNLASALSASISAATVPDAADRDAATAVAAGLATLLGDLLIADAIMSYAPELMFVLALLGLADWHYVEPADPDSGQPSYVEQRLRLERLPALFGHPADHFRDSIGWGTDTFDPLELFETYRQYFPRHRTIEYGSVGGDAFLRQGAVTTQRNSEHSPPGLKVQWQREFSIEEDVQADINDQWSAQLTGRLSLATGAIADIQPPLTINVSAPAEVSGDVRLFAERTDEAPPIDLLAGLELLSIRIAKAAIGVGLTANWQPTDGTASVDIVPFATLTGVTVTLGAADADSFIGELLGALNMSGTFDLTVEWSAAQGLHVRASGGMETRLPVHRSLGFATLESIYLAQRTSSEGTLLIEASAAISGAFGPLTAAVDRIGATIDVRFADDASGRFGRFGLGIGFKPPTGVGLAIDAGMVKGGGYLSYDPDKAEYAGVLELALLDYVTVKAIGLVTTRLPDGQPGFSLLLILTAEFGAGIQLGFGFTLLGVGGLLGVNRSMRLDPLLAAVRSGAIQSVMFPTDVVANAPRILSDLRTFFPPARGVFLIGPMAKLGWGTPPLITLSLGIIVEIPGNVAILGVLKVMLPDERASLIRLQVNFVGAIEFSAQRAWLYAALFESRILQTTVDGEMGVLLAWGDQANFVVSVGGFHPQFQPPAMPFPVPQRISSTILDADYGRIRIAGYFAVTTNTVQFGAQAELYFGISAASIQGHLSFDALFHFNPFRFAIDIATQADVKLFGVGLFSVALRLTLAGPSPWRATGYGEISLLFWSKKVSFDVTWGAAADTTLPSIAVLPLLADEFRKAANWRAILPARTTSGVSLRSLPQTTAIVLHPLGRLAVSQRAVPLDLQLDQVGGRRPADGGRFHVELVGGDLVKAADVDESFAIGQFEDLDDASALNAAAFQALPGGIEAAPAGHDYRVGDARLRTVRYETVILDRQAEPETDTHVGYPGRLFTHLLAGNAAARSAGSQRRREQLVPFADKVVAGADTFVVAGVADNTMHGAAVFTSPAQAARFLADAVAGQPGLAAGLHVIASYERAGAA